MGVKRLICGPALTTHGSLDLQQEIQIQTANCPELMAPFKPLIKGVSLRLSE
jgi:hypothetical protein